jgi:hypothetical protein
MTENADGRNEFSFTLESHDDVTRAKKYATDLAMVGVQSDCIERSPLTSGRF